MGGEREFSWSWGISVPSTSCLVRSLKSVRAGRLCDSQHIHAHHSPSRHTLRSVMTSHIPIQTIGWRHKRNRSCRESKDRRMLRPVLHTCTHTHFLLLRWKDIDRFSFLLLNVVWWDREPKVELHEGPPLYWQATSKAPQKEGQE